MANQEPPIPISIRDLPDVELPHELRWEGTFGDYLGKVLAYPRTVRTAFQRVYDSILYYGKSEYTYLHEKIVHYNLFDDPFSPNHEWAAYDLDPKLMRLVKIIRAGAYKYGQQKRILLLHGPVGSSKSTISNLLCLALEEYSKTEAGQTYQPLWMVEENDTQGIEILGKLGEIERNRFVCPLHEEPLRILPRGPVRNEVIKYLNDKVANTVEKKNAGKRDKDRDEPHIIEVEGDTCPRCEQIFDQFMVRYKYDWKQVLEKHLRVGRMVFSRSKRVGIAGVRPKSEKDQDAAELSGQTNYAALAKFGDEVDPRTFNFRGHFESSNRGIFYGEEMLKAVLGFLYDYLGASQEQRVQPRGFPEIDVDLLILGSTNQEEVEKLKGKKEMAALRDRIIKINIPYALRLSNERKIYEKWFNVKKCHDHVAPGTIDLGAHWAISTRLKEPKKLEMSLRDKAKLYDGKQVSGFNEDSIKELRQEARDEGMQGISPRFVQDQISNAFVSDEAKGCVNFFVLINQIKEALPDHQHINSPELLEQYEHLLAESQEELTETLKMHVRRAIGDEKAIRVLAGKYLDTVMAVKMGRKVHNTITGQEEEPNTRFLDDIENAGGITAHDEFREKVTNQIAQRALDRARDPKIPDFDYTADEKLANALELYLFEQEKNKINWEATISRSIIDNKEQEKIDIVLTRLKELFGYCDVCAGEVLMYVASIFYRGEKTKKNS